MIAIPRKYLPCLFLSPNSFLCKSNVHFFLSIHLFSTSRVKTVIPTPEIYDVLVHKHQLSPKLVSLVASHLPRFRIPQNIDSVVSFLKENSFTTGQLDRIVTYNPRILGFTVENVRFRLKVFLELGLSSEEIAKLMSRNQVILHSSIANKIIPSLSLLKGLLGSNDIVARLVRKCSWLIRSDLENTLMPNVEFLKSYGIPMERILHLIYTCPRCFLVKPGIMRKSVDRALQIGASPTSLNFIRAASVFTCTSEGMWEIKLQTLRDLGFSDNDIFAMFRKAPLVFSLSTKKIRNVIELLRATGKYSVSDIVINASSLGCSIEKRLQPRLQILRLLQSRNLIEKWPGLSTLAFLTDERFFDRFVGPYLDEIDEEGITKVYVEAKNK